MKKVWKAVALIAAAVLVLGLICIAVGYITGSSVQNAKELFDAKYYIDFDGFYKSLASFVNNLLGMQAL